jgi:hypothetical protein
MRGIRGLGLGQLGWLADGSPVVGTSSGPQPISQAVASALQQSPQSNAQSMVNAVPAGASGGNVQGRGLVFVYQTPNIAALAPGIANSQVIQFDQNSVFCWLRTTFTCDLSNAAQTNESLVNPFITLQITDTGNGMSFMNGPVPLQSLAGYAAQLPYVLPTPQWVQSNASYNFAFTSYSTTGGGDQTYNNVRLQLHGFRVFNTGQAGTGS